jgi:hypothetical protein
VFGRDLKGERVVEVWCCGAVMRDIWWFDASSCRYFLVDCCRSLFLMKNPKLDSESHSSSIRCIHVIVGRISVRPQIRFPRSSSYAPVIYRPHYFTCVGIIKRLVQNGASWYFDNIKDIWYFLQIMASVPVSSSRDAKIILLPLETTRLFLKSEAWRK